MAGLVGDPCAERETVRRLHAVDAETYADWETIYLDNVQRLYRLMYSRVGNRPDAEDLTSEVFMAALETDGPRRRAVGDGGLGGRRRREPDHALPEG